MLPVFVKVTVSNACAAVFYSDTNFISDEENDWSTVSYEGC